jgi:hypothetical protein
MYYTLVRHLALLGKAAAAALRDDAGRRPRAEAGQTLEWVILILGAITVASILVAALTQAVQARVAQIH